MLFRFFFLSYSLIKNKFQLDLVTRRIRVQNGVLIVGEESLFHMEKFIWKSGISAIFGALGNHVIQK